MRRDPRLLAVLVVLVVAGVIGYAEATKPAPVSASTTPSPAAVPITERALVCPQAGGQPAGGAAYLAYADGSTDEFGPSISTSPLDPDGVPGEVKVTPRHAWTVAGPKTVGPVRVVIDGQSAASVGVAQVTRQKIASSWQLSATPCGEPTTDAWFAGFSTGVGAHATLLLGNVDDVAASVDIGIYADDQPARADAQNGVQVPPHSQTAIKLDTIAPGFSNVAVHVTTTSGRVAPAIRYDTEDGSIPRGVEWVPQTQGPATKQVVTGIVGGDGGRRLILSTPGDVDATVQVTVVTADGFTSPTELDEIDVPAGQVESVDLAPVLNKADAAVLVTSSEPVVAAAVSTLPKDASGGSDIAITAAAPPLSGPVIVPGGESGAGQRTRLLLTAPAEDAHPTLTLIPSSPTSRQLVSPLNVAGGTTLTVDLRSLSSDPAPGISLEPGPGGPVYAAWVVQESSGGSAGITSFPLRAHLTSLQRPVVQADPMAGLPIPARSPAATPSGEPSSEMPSDLPSDVPGDLPSGVPSDVPDGGESGAPPGE